MGDQPAIQAEGLSKRFGDVHALQDLNLTVSAGSVLGLLGPNGAGKTTAVRILTTLLRPDTGSARVVGLDVRQPAAVRQVIGLAGQSAAVDDYLTGQENLVMAGRLHHLHRSEAHRRAAELLQRFELAEAADRPVRTWSAACAAAWTWPSAWSATPRCCSWTSPAAAWTRAAATSSASVGLSTRAPPCCSPPSTWRRPTSSPTRSWSSTAAASSPTAP